jgi:hypothetical protein
VIGRCTHCIVTYVAAGTNNHTMELRQVTIRSSVCSRTRVDNDCSDNLSVNFAVISDVL